MVNGDRRPSAVRLAIPGVAATLESIEWKESLGLRIYGVRIGIRSTVPGILKRLASYLPPTWKPLRTPSVVTRLPVVDRLYSLRIDTRKRRPFHQLFEGSEPGLGSRDLEAVLEDFERRVKIYVAEMAPRRVFVHAGTVGWRGRAIVIPGPSYSGKTSLVRALIDAGASYYSDEYAVLDGRGRVHPYPQPLAIRERGSGRQIGHPIATLGGVEGVRPLPIGLVIVCPYKEGARWRPRELSSGQAVLELLANTVPARRRPEVVIPTLGKAVTDAVTLKGPRGEAAKIARLVLRRLEQVPRPPGKAAR